MLHKLFCPGGPGSGTPGGGSGCPLPIGSPLALSGEDCICWPGNEAVDAVECREAAVDGFLVDLGKLKEAVDEEDDTFVDCRLRTCRPHFLAAFAAVLRWEAVGGGRDWLADLLEDDMEGDLVVGSGMLGDRGVGKPGSSISLPGVVGNESLRRLSDMRVSLSVSFEETSPSVYSSGVSNKTSRSISRGGTSSASDSASRAVGDDI